jgi:hypothetical protein
VRRIGGKAQRRLRRDDIRATTHVDNQIWLPSPFILREWH